MGMLLYINGAPGVGKLTVARALASSLAARVLDNHAIYNVGFALADFRSPAFYNAVRAVRAATYGQILRAADNETIILTAADFVDNEWGRESWETVEKLAFERRWPFYSIALHCDISEHRKRIASEDRARRGKLQDVTALDLLVTRPLAVGSGSRSLRLDNTHMAAIDTAAYIAAWIDGQTAE